MGAFYARLGSGMVCLLQSVRRDWFIKPHPLNTSLRCQAVKADAATNVSKGI